MDEQLTEQQSLRAERARLDQLRRELQDETARLDGTDLVALLAYGERLTRHKLELDRFIAALAAYHAQYGPLGD
jgi:hypothetical protein